MTARPPVSSPPAAASDLVPDTAAEVVTDGLRTRTGPGLDEAVLRDANLTPGTIVFVVAGPVAADGYDWYQVQPFDPSLPFGWVAAADHDGTPWIEPAVLACPEAATLRASDLAALTPLGALACYGSGDVTVTGRVHCEGADVDRSVSGPSWLRSNAYCGMDLEDGTEIEWHNGGFVLGFPPPGTLVKIDGHFDDPQASSCVYGLEGAAPDPASVILGCRTQFVAMDMRSP
ncbi:MAG TPA: hypothetical protein VK871_12710 [Candidatus Limnocylindrales bacterium]|nr:hypothetical protein [Candidatus Limnocylindrales bacterium]